MKPAYKPIIVRPVARLNSEINVTPLVDVVLVLLIIFMVVTPLLEAQLPVKLPETRQVQALEEEPSSQIVVRLAGSSTIEINGKAVDEAAGYFSEMRAAISERPAGKRIVFFVAGDEVGYARLVTVLDGAKAAGAEVLGMASRAP